MFWDTAVSTGYDLRNEASASVATGWSHDERCSSARVLFAGQFEIFTLNKQTIFMQDSSRTEISMQMEATMASEVTGRRMTLSISFGTFGKAASYQLLTLLAENFNGKIYVHCVYIFLATVLWLSHYMCSQKSSVKLYTLRRILENLNNSFICIHS